MADADTIHRLAEILFTTATETNTNIMTAFNFEFEPKTRVKYSTFTVPISQLPEDLRQKLTDSVERNAAAFLYDLGIICKMVVVPDYGRAFHLSLPGELVGLSWSKILSELGYGQPKDDAR